jgi:hypothetical protein
VVSLLQERQESSRIQTGYWKLSLQRLKEVELFEEQGGPRFDLRLEHGAEPPSWIKAAGCADHITLFDGGDISGSTVLPEPA